MREVSGAGLVVVKADSRPIGLDHFVRPSVERIRHAVRQPLGPPGRCQPRVGTLPAPDRDGTVAAATSWLVQRSCGAALVGLWAADCCVAEAIERSLEHADPIGLGN